MVQNKEQQRVIVILAQASLETVKVGKDGKYSLLNSEDHLNILKKHNKDPSKYRPDITHQCLLSLLDSPLNKAGKLQVFIHTAKNVLIEVNPSVRIPRTFKRFCGLMVQLLHKLSIRSINGPEKLLKVIRNPIIDHLPVGCRLVTLSGDVAPMRASDFCKTLDERSICFFIGAMAHGDDDFGDGLVVEKLSVSEYPLSASVACSKIMVAFEEVWGIL